MSERATATFELPADEASRVRCMACAGRACEALGKVPGVSHVDCDAPGGMVSIEFDPARVGESDLQVEMERFGLELAESVRHEAWQVTGLD
jgi:copper chaperone CopZ